MLFSSAVPPTASAASETFSYALRKRALPEMLGDVRLSAGQGLVVGTTQAPPWHRWATLLWIPALAFGAATAVFALDTRASLAATLVLTGMTSLLASGAVWLNERGRIRPRFVLHAETSTLRLEPRARAPMLIPFGEVRSVEVESAQGVRSLSVRHGEGVRFRLIDCVQPAEWETLERVQRLFESILRTGEAARELAAENTPATSAT
ncbi:MAG: hypothetical protein ACKVPX_02150 [Myxococcaceae bacterium]